MIYPYQIAGLSDSRNYRITRSRLWLDDSLVLTVNAKGMDYPAVAVKT